MFTSRRKLLSQNFLHNRKLVKSLIRKSSIGKNDTVIDLGAGRGIITESLTPLCKRVIALELDPKYYRFLIQRFQHSKNVTVLHQDILNYYFPRYPYKVFANIPFSIEGKIIRLLLNCHNPADEAYLVLRKDLAYRLAGVKQESMFSVLYKPWFEFSVIHHFNRTDFSPFARMDTVLIRIIKRTNPLLRNNERSAYKLFVRDGFSGGKRINYNLRNWFSKEDFNPPSRNSSIVRSSGMGSVFRFGRISAPDKAYIQNPRPSGGGSFNRICQKLHISPSSRPSQLSSTNWLSIFNAIYPTTLSPNFN